MGELTFITILTMNSTFTRYAAVFLLVCILQKSESFTTAFSGRSLAIAERNAGSASLHMEYIPSGMTKAQWEKRKAQDKAKQGKNLGKVGITSFKSQSFSEWQKNGAKHLFPVDPKTAKSEKELPYMQRAGGSVDDDDLKKPNMFSNLFGKKKKVEKAPEEPKKTNWWTGN